MKNILFWDACCNKPYTLDAEQNEALGGTERTVLRVAKGLQLAGHDVSLYSHFNDDIIEPIMVQGLRHVGLESMFLKPDVVIHLRTAACVNVLSQAFPDAKHIVWHHDIATEMQYENEHKDYTNVSAVIAVSEYHKITVESMLRRYNKMRPVYVINNPVDVSGVQCAVAVPGKAAFISSPHKGLKQVLEVFKAAKAEGILSSLYVANPGYVTLEMEQIDGVYTLGELPHRKVMEELSTCEVLLYPQTVFPETFGLVFAEANTLGVPVLAYDMGAAKEVLAANNPPFREHTIEGWLKRLRQVMSLKVTPMIKEPFRLENVIKAWENVL